MKKDATMVMKKSATKSKSLAATKDLLNTKKHLLVNHSKRSETMQLSTTRADKDSGMQATPDITRIKETALSVVELIAMPEFPEGEAGTDSNSLAALFKLEKVKLDILVEQKVESNALLSTATNYRDFVLPNKMTDMQVANCFSTACVDLLRFFPERKKWLVYDQKCWNADAPGGAFPLFKDILALLNKKINEIEDEDKRIGFLSQTIKLESHKRQETILSAAKVIPDIIIASSQLDQDPMLLNCLNGTLDLTTGKMQPHKASDFITKLVSISHSADAECPEFLRFLDRIMGGNQALISYLQRFIGYCLTGDNSEQVLVFFYGTGANGKSTLTNIIELLLSDYARTAGSSLLMNRDNNAASNDLASLHGARLVKVSEFDEDERLAEATIKSLTGGDRICCRFLFGEFFEYIPQYKILLLGNHKPNIRGRDHGIWRRIHIVPFNITVPDNERDPKLTEKLTAELPGILAWAVKGCLEWQKIGLCPPNEVKEEGKAYRQSQDIFKQWIDDCCIEGDEHCTSASDLYQSFINYSNRRDVTPKKLGQLLAVAGFQKKKSGTMSWHGISLE